ncbi:polyamine aminopropyltransferase [Marivibrio halodurans]|uniref:Polyamine aminopropyltransferase n=1 Tax=Marivibrio halodurans TaxID=2039722 RepID=A0A8J7V2R1_9PROT|nr:polyamine aminopropyltransferase [Marivibrio halodurans]MBP5859081.1 polyamine aminopropyltransferase [Marivibrio halodurans]
MADWFDETLHDDYRQGLRIDRVLYQSNDGLQDLIVFENARFGRVLCLDGVVQTTEGDEFVYHEMLTHVPILAHGRVEDVLIVGGGDGGMAREVLKHPAVRPVMVEIDPDVVEFSKQHLPRLSNGAFDDPRLELVIADGCRFVKETEKRFDVVIVDSTDPIGPGEVLFTAEFYADCKRCLKPGGVVVTQNGVPFVQGGEITDSYRRLGESFADVHFFRAAIPTYQGGDMAFGWASDDPDPRRQSVEVIEARFADAGIETRYYTPDLHVASFALPRTIKDLMR